MTATYTFDVFSSLVSGDVRCGDGWGCLRH
jgi:hypothetical protein